MNFTDYAKSHVRTIVPAIAGFVITVALHYGLDLHAYSAAIDTVVTVVYFAAARAAERYVSPQFGWLLGSPGAPAYTAAPDPAPAAPAAG